MPYYNQVDPTEMAQLSGNPFYNPLQPGPDWVRGIQALYANLQGAKDKKKTEKQAEEDRRWEILLRPLQKQLLEAQVGETQRANIPKPPIQKGYQLPPATLAEIAKYHGFKDSTEYDQYDPQFQQDMAKEYMDAKAAWTLRGMKGTPTKQGAIKLKMIDTALAQINKRAGEVGGELRSLIMQPLSDPDGTAREVDKKVLSNLNRLRMRFSTYPFKMNEDGTLPEAYERELIDYLNAPDAVETGRAFDTQKPTPTVKLEAPPRPGKIKGETATSPSGQMFIWDGSKWVKK